MAVQYSEPEGYLTPIRIQNTLTGKLQELRTILPNTVLFYICGPTVYDSSHLGHARTYLTFDIVRRIMENHFGLNVIYQCNITDVDDKIIRRAGERGQTIYDVCRRYEREFLEDMQALRVKPFSVVTRVTEYMEENIRFVQGIINHGFGYISNGSVYFDVSKFTSERHLYPKFRPAGVASGEDMSKLLQEGEGVLQKNRVDEKRSPFDYALWKGWKPEEPEEARWDAVFYENGRRVVVPGRPGWHLECSVMASAVLGRLGGGRFDLHAGGMDLQFPHHDNEVAQTEAYYGTYQPINYFMHAGHLKIAGDVMSKSKGNFTTIRKALELFTPNQIRMLFVQVPYSSSLDYSMNMMEAAVSLDKKVSSFLANLKLELEEAERLQSEPGAGIKMTAQELEYVEAIGAALSRIHEFYCLNFDYPSAVKEIFSIIDLGKKYLNSAASGADGDAPAGGEEEAKTQAQARVHKSPFLLKQFRDAVLGNLSVLGFQYGSQGPQDGASPASGPSSAALPVVELVRDFRQDVREAVTGAEDLKQAKVAILKACDRIRDDLLPPMGYSLEDVTEGGKTTTSIKEIDVAQWLVDRRRQEELAEAKRAKQEAARRAKAEKEAEDREKAKLRAEDMFRDDPQYSLFDEQGIPTHLAEADPGDPTGHAPVPKKSLKKLQKAWEAQKRLNQKYAEGSAEGPAEDRVEA